MNERHTLLEELEDDLYHALTVVNKLYRQGSEPRLPDGGVVKRGGSIDAAEIMKAPPVLEVVGEPGVPLMIEPDEELLDSPALRAMRDHMSGSVIDGDIKALNDRLKEIRQREAASRQAEDASSDFLRRGGEEISYAPGKPL